MTWARKRRVAKNILSPTELFDYRLAALLGYVDIDLMKRSMTYRHYLGWQKYWDDEPWGPWRDNFHAALLAREIRRTAFKSGLELKNFMYVNPVRSMREGDAKLEGMLTTVGKKVSAKEAQRILSKSIKRRKKAKANDRSRKAGRKT